jgi:hypothetical protein
MERTSDQSKNVIRVTLLLTLMLGVTSCQKKPSESTEVPNESREVPLAKFSTLFSHDQRRGSHVQAWGKSWVSTSNGKHSNSMEPHKRYYELDLAKMVAHELLPPNSAEIVGIATGGQNQQLALVRDSSAILLFARNGEMWQPIEIPKELSASQAPFFHFVSDGDRLLILTEDVLWHRLDGTWQSWSLPTVGAPGAKPDSRTSFALMGSKLYLGFSRGEWGGGIATLDLTSRVWSKAPTSEEMEMGLPVSGFKRDPSGALWVFEGLAHMNSLNASVRVLKQDRWVEFANVSGYLDYESEALVARERKNWDAPPAVFMDLAFDATGRVHLLTNSLGILRFEQGKWLRLTKKWFDFSYRETNYRTGSPPGELVLADDHTAILAAGEFGVLVWDLNSEKITRIPIKRQ